MPAIGSVNVKISATTAGLTKGLSSASSSIASFGSKLVSMTGVVGAATLGFNAVQGALSGISGTLSGVAGLEQTSVAFEVLLGSAEKAKTVLADVQTFAAETPFEFPELAGSARMLAAFGTASEQIVPELKMIGDVASGISQPIGEIAEIYGKARVQGRLFGEDINQLTGRGIPIIGELAKQFNVSESQVKKLVEEGKVGFPQLEKAFQSMTGEGGKFSGMMARQSSTLGGLWSTLTDNISSTAQTIASTVLTAFDTKAIIASFISATSWIKSTVTSLTPVIVSTAGVIKAAFSLVTAYIGGVFTPILNAVGFNFETVKAGAITTGEYLKATFEGAVPVATQLGVIVGQVWLNIASGAQWLGDSIAAIWAWIGDTTGFTWDNISSTISTATSNIIGFIWNIGENSELLLGWLQENWQNIFKDIASGVIVYLKNLAQNIATGLNTVYRLFSALSGWIVGLFKRLFSFQVVDAVLTGLIIVGTKIREWASAAWSTITSIFSGKKPSKALDNFIKTTKTDFQKGMENLNLASTFNDILKEESAKFKSPFDGFKSSLTKLPDMLTNVPTLGGIFDWLSGKSKPEIPKLDGNLFGNIPYISDAIDWLTGKTAPKPNTTPETPNPDGMPPGLAPDGQVPDKTKTGSDIRQIESTETFNRGTSDAYSAIFKAMRGGSDQRKLVDAAQQQAKTSQELLKLARQEAVEPKIEIVAGGV